MLNRRTTLLAGAAGLLTPAWAQKSPRPQLATAAAFDRVERPSRVLHVENGVPVAGWAVWVCHGFRGYAAPAAAGPGY